MGGSEWSCQLQRVVIFGFNSLQQCGVIVCCVAVDKRKDVHTDGEECELCGCLFIYWEVSEGDPRFHIENHHLQSEEVAILDIDYHNAVKGSSQVAEGVRKVCYPIWTSGRTKDTRFMSCEVVSG